MSMFALASAKLVQDCLCAAIREIKVKKKNVYDKNFNNNYIIFNIIKCTK